MILTIFFNYTKSDIVSCLHVKENDSADLGWYCTSTSLYEYMSKITQAFPLMHLGKQYKLNVFHKYNETPG